MGGAAHSGQRGFEKYWNAKKTAGYRGVHTQMESLRAKAVFRLIIAGIAPDSLRFLSAHRIKAALFPKSCIIGDIFA